MEKHILPITAASALTKKQTKHFTKAINYHGEPATITAKVRWDDECNNGRNSFAVTATITATGTRKGRGGYYSGREIACGCLHDEVAEHFPELAHLIKWHLCAADGPMHYLANTIYLAGDRDSSGRRAGEPSSWEHVVQFGDNPIKHNLRASFAKFLQAGAASGFAFQIVKHEHAKETGSNAYRFKPKFTFDGYGDKWHECPFDLESEAQDFLVALKTCAPKFMEIPTAWSEGKARELDGARRAAVWPDATDEDLTAPGLRERLLARLPELLAALRKDIEAAGFVW